MMNTTNRTHDPSAVSWVASANDGTTDFPIQNLPFGVFRPAASAHAPTVGVAIGDHILDIAACSRAGLFERDAAIAAAACASRHLNDLMALGPGPWSALRRAVFDLLDADHADAERHGEVVGPLLLPQARAELFVPADIGDYTDFYASVFHATNVGRMMRPDNPLLPNYKYVPIGYHGRSSSIQVSGAPVRRPWGQTRPEGAETPLFGPSKRLDYELEVGAYVGVGNDLGSPVPLDTADAHLFGLCLLNDWSARDMQAWEYQPLGPFLAKSFATTVSPWVVTMEALAPFRVAPFARPDGDPAPLPYLDSTAHRVAGGTEVHLEAAISSQRMRDEGLAAMRLSRSNLSAMYWTFGQMAAHHASNGCNLRPGDLLGSGTVSGPEKDARGCLLELAWRGAEPVTLPTGERRAFLEEGDEVTLRGWCERDGAARIGFGACRGVILPAVGVPQV
ncbi:MAG: fumarylacetoacetase [Vicinamibacterales bacterium]|nr:fumarylacetoacetase [Vicinamibacterales bacterium]